MLSYGGYGGFGGYPGYGGFSGYGGYPGFGGYPGYGGLAPFLYRLSPGTPVIYQYDAQPPQFGIFQGIQGFFVLITPGFGSPFLIRIPIWSLNAITPL